MSGVWNSSAVSSAAPCRPALRWFCPLSGPGAALAPSLASLACYNEAGMPGMCECILPRAPQLPTSNLLSTFWVSFKHSLSPPLPSSHTLLHISHSIPLTQLLIPPLVPLLTRLKPPTSVPLAASLPNYHSFLKSYVRTNHREIRL